MKLATFLAGTVAGLAVAGSASAVDLTIVSWGGAYSASQLKAYHQPYMAEHPDVSIINDESSNEAVAKMRAMEEAGNITWDLVDVEGPDFAAPLRRGAGDGDRLRRMAGAGR